MIFLNLGLSALLPLIYKWLYRLLHHLALKAPEEIDQEIRKVPEPLSILFETEFTR